MVELDKRFLEVCKQGPSTEVDVMLAQGASLAAVDEKARGPLHYATAYMGPRQDVVARLLPERRQIIATLLAAGAPHSALDAQGRTPLWWAAAYLDRACCELLLDAGGTDVADAENKTALQAAVEHGNLATTTLLLDRGEIATAKLVTLADERFHMKIAAALRTRAGLPDPFRDDPHKALLIFAKQLGHHARESAEASGDRAHYEERDDLDPDDLCIEYWLGHYKSVAREGLDSLDETVRAALPDSEAMLEDLYDAYCAGYDSASGS